eukprot:ctg_172.g109
MPPSTTTDTDGGGGGGGSSAAAGDDDDLFKRAARLRELDGTRDGMYWEVLVRDVAVGDLLQWYAPRNQVETASVVDPVALMSVHAVIAGPLQNALLRADWRAMGVAPPGFTEADVEAAVAASTGDSTNPFGHASGTMVMPLSGNAASGQRLDLDVDIRGVDARRVYWTEALPPGPRALLSTRFEASARLVHRPGAPVELLAADEHRSGSGASVLERAHARLDVRRLQLNDFQYAPRMHGQVQYNTRAGFSLVAVPYREEEEVPGGSSSPSPLTPEAPGHLPGRPEYWVEVRADPTFRQELVARLCCGRFAVDASLRHGTHALLRAENVPLAELTSADFPLSGMADVNASLDLQAQRAVARLRCDSWCLTPSAVTLSAATCIGWIARSTCPARVAAVVAGARGHSERRRGRSGGVGQHRRRRSPAETHPAELVAAGAHDPDGEDVVVSGSAGGEPRGGGARGIGGTTRCDRRCCGATTQPAGFARHVSRRGGGQQQFGRAVVRFAGRGLAPGAARAGGDAGVRFAQGRFAAAGAAFVGECDDGRLADGRGAAARRRGGERRDDGASPADGAGAEQRDGAGDPGWHAERRGAPRAGVGPSPEEEGLQGILRKALHLSARSVGSGVASAGHRATESGAPAAAAVVGGLELVGAAVAAGYAAAADRRRRQQRAGRPDEHRPRGTDVAERAVATVAPQWWAGGLVGARERLGERPASGSARAFGQCAAVASRTHRSGGESER